MLEILLIEPSLQSEGALQTSIFLKHVLHQSKAKIKVVFPHANGFFSGIFQPCNCRLR